MYLIYYVYYQKLVHNHLSVRYQLKHSDSGRLQVEAVTILLDLLLVHFGSALFFEAVF